ncbi:trigger factor [Candidatus Gracilibacteria bacterium]|nr:trigger factor [Candidatus Gracilibacteria bacterium]
MKSSIKKLEKSIIELTIEESKENIAKYRKKVLNDLRKNADIKGFRKGSHIPDEVILKNYSEERISTLMIDEALNKLYGEALKENKILPIAQGEVKEIKSQDPLIVVMHIEVFPEVSIDDKYKSIKLKKNTFKVEEKEVLDALDEIQKKFTHFHEAENDYEAKTGDKLFINTTGYDVSGNKLENTSMENYPLVLGSNVLVPGFEDGLVGKKVNDKVKLNITFPKDYHNDSFKGKETIFDVEILKIEKSHKPEFTPEFIKDLRGKELDFEGFKALIREELLETKETNARMLDENALMDELMKISKVDFGDSMLKNQTSRVYEEIKQNIIQSGAKVNDYISSLGLTENDYIEKNIKPIAIKRLTSELILHKLAEIEKTTVTQEEATQEIEKIMSRFGSEDVVKRLKELYTPGTKYYEELSQRIVYRKLIDSFFN